jgi:hypothetical protein
VTEADSAPTVVQDEREIDTTSERERVPAGRA